MTKRTLKILCCLLLTVATVLPLVSLPAYADGSHGLYMECSIGPVNNRADGFMIDFYSDADNALATYYSNANWGMYTVPTVRKNGYKSMIGGGAYAGLQITYRSNMRKGIMSFWRYECTDWMDNVTYLYADTMMGRSTHYDNEGSGTSCVMDYNWDCGTWYRELIQCWTDAETGETFMGNWYYNYTTDHWDLFVYYNTHLWDSYINSGVSQFLENFSQSYRENVRNFRYKGVYVLSHDDGNWVSSPNVKIFTDSNVNAVGETSMGIAEDGSYVWGQVDGASSIDSDTRKEATYTINQPATPQSIGKPAIGKMVVTENADGESIVSWEMGEHSTPELTTRITVLDENNMLLYSKTQTRPDLSEVNLGDLKSDTYRVTLSVTDVFGQKTTANYGYGLRGDLDHNGTVSISDVTLLLLGIQNNYAIGSHPEMDLSGDGAISISDVTTLLLIMKG